MSRGPGGGVSTWCSKEAGKNKSGYREVWGSQCRESMLDRESLAKSLHFNYKEIDAHINSHISVA